MSTSLPLPCPLSKPNDCSDIIYIFMHSQEDIFGMCINLLLVLFQTAPQTTYTICSSTIFSQCVDNTMDTPPHAMDRRYCEEFASRITNVKYLPVECQEKYSDIVMDLKRRDTDATHPTQFLS
jgi:hypothetical protein